MYVVHTYMVYTLEVYIYTRTHTYMHTCTYAHTHTHTHTRTHARTHTHTQSICIYTTLYVTILSFIIYAYPESGASEHPPTISITNNMNADNIPVDIITMFHTPLVLPTVYGWTEISRGGAPT